MLWTPGAAASIRVDNWGVNPAGAPGTGVTAGINNLEGTWTAIMSALSNEVVGFWVAVSQYSSSTNIKKHLLDIGIDPAGGTSWVELIPNIVIGQPGTTVATGGAKGFFFPIRVPAGATVAARVRGSHSAAQTGRVIARFYMGLDRPYMFPVGQYAETIGVTEATTDGTSFTPGNAADGTWTLLGTTTRDCWWWQLGWQINNGTTTVEYTYIDLGVGDGTIAGTQRIKRMYHVASTSEQVSCGGLDSNPIPFESYFPVKAGSTLYVRGRCSDAPDTGYQAAAIGIGG